MTKIQSINPNKLYIAQNAEVSLKLAGNTAQVTFTAGKNKKCPIKNLSKDEFVDLSTGEVKKRRHSENRFQSPKSVRKSINSLMDLIRCNATNFQLFHLFFRYLFLLLPFEFLCQQYHSFLGHMFL